MKQLPGVLIVLLMSSLVFADEGGKAKAGQPDKLPAGYKVIEPSPFEITLTLDGVFEPKTMWPIEVELDEWSVSSIKVLEAAPQGTHVKKGDIITKFDTEALDRTLDDLKMQREAIALNLKQTAEQLRFAEADLPREQRLAQRHYDRVKADYERYRQTERAMAEAYAEKSLETAQHRYEYAREELNQLQQMYDADDLTEETEEIILKRQKYAVEDAKFKLERAEYQTNKTLKINLPRQDEDWLKSVRDAEIRLDHARTVAPIELRQKQHAMEKLRIESKRLNEKISELESDREMLTVKAPAGGVVYYGRYERGKWHDAAEVDKAIVRNNGIRPGAVYMVIVEPNAMKLTTTIPEQQLYRAKPGAAGWATPSGYPDKAVKVTLESVGHIAMIPGQYDATLSLDGPADVTAGMTAKAHLNVYESDTALVVPLKAVDLSDPTEPTIHVLNDDGEPTERRVKLGWRSDEQVEILDGLQAGQAVRIDKQAAEKSQDN